MRIWKRGQRKTPVRCGGCSSSNLSSARSIAGAGSAISSPFSSFGPGSHVALQPFELSARDHAADFLLSAEMPQHDVALNVVDASDVLVNAAVVLAVDLVVL